ncbi:unnamed protein product [Brachionus calyciflorus]|uniref:Uncharacterized protein n=1 Tax=Brachionus calyciflorus TaxID=104777 RepID=A0A814AW71_9BILA|nr:unnamed protein product [Brachionus calyciflorus]
MDETTIYLDSPSSYTFDKKGAKPVKASTAGMNEHKRRIVNYVPQNNVRLIYKNGATFNEDTVVEYTGRILLSFMLDNQIYKAQLILDCAKCHQTLKVKKSPGYEKCIQWLSEIWTEFDPKLLIDSFDFCGITSQFNLHKTLDLMLKNNTLVNDYIDIVQDADELECFNFNHSDIFDEPLDNLEIEEIEQNAPLPSTSRQNKVLLLLQFTFKFLNKKKSCAKLYF